MKKILEALFPPKVYYSISMERLTPNDYEGKRISLASMNRTELEEDLKKITDTNHLISYLKRKIEVIEDLPMIKKRKIAKRLGITDIKDFYQKIELS